LREVKILRGKGHGTQKLKEKKGETRKENPIHLYGNWRARKCSVHAKGA